MSAHTSIPENSVSLKGETITSVLIRIVTALLFYIAVFVSCFQFGPEIISGFKSFILGYTLTLQFLAVTLFLFACIAVLSYVLILPTFFIFHEDPDDGSFNLQR